VEGRLKALEEKSLTSRLGPEEMAEYQRLTSIRGARAARGG
jgi:hypothetical protein